MHVIGGSDNHVHTDFDHLHPQYLHPRISPASLEWTSMYRAKMLHVLQAQPRCLHPLQKVLKTPPLSWIQWPPAPFGFASAALIPVGLKLHGEWAVSPICLSGLCS